MRTVGAEMFHANKETDRQIGLYDAANIRFSLLSEAITNCQEDKCVLCYYMIT
jgi:hypothetical protein